MFEIRNGPLQFLGLVQHHDRIGDILHPHLLNIYAAMVSLALDILHGKDRIRMDKNEIFYIIWTGDGGRLFSIPEDQKT